MIFQIMSRMEVTNKFYIAYNIIVLAILLFFLSVIVT